jgi:hypothetical protein
MIRAALVVAAVVSLVAPAAAHHGGGTFDGSKELKLTGTFTGLDLVNPHSWIYFEVTGPDGKVTKYSDVIGVADLPYKPDPCKELGFLDYSKDAKK